VFVAVAGTGHTAPKVNASNSAAKIRLNMIFLSLYGYSGGLQYLNLDPPCGRKAGNVESLV
jgi:hypothetical protein